MANPTTRPSSAGKASRRPKSKPFPLQQLLILALIRFGEPIAFTSIFPYIYYMIESFHIAADERAVSIYAGVLISSFALAEFSGAAIWGSLSDRIGRKPVLLIGLFGTGLSMLIFGFSRNLPLAITARVLGGLLNGNIGVIQTAVAEMVTVKEQRPRAYTFMPLTWCIGAILGSLLGGALADPISKYPNVFKAGGILEKYPFLLPNLVATAQCALSVVIGLLFLEETHAIKRHERDRTRELGSWLVQNLNLFKRYKERKLNGHLVKEDETSKLLTSSVPPSYNGGDASGTIPSNSRDAATVGKAQSDEERAVAAPKISMRAAFTSQVILVVIAYGLLALHTVVFDMLLPVTLSMSESDDPASLPFKFSGGFGLSSTSVGLVLALQAIYNGFYQLLAAPPLIRKFGNLRMFRFLSITYPLMYIATPYLVLLPPTARMIALAILIIWKVSFGSLAYLSVTLLITYSAPSMLVLGMINGVAASAASLARAIGPTMFGAIHSTTLQHGYGSIAWLVAAIVAVLGAVEALWLKELEDPSEELQEEEEEDSAAVIQPGSLSGTIHRASMTAPEAASGGMTLLENEELDAVITHQARETALEGEDNQGDL